MREADRGRRLLALAARRSRLRAEFGLRALLGAGALEICPQSVALGGQIDREGDELIVAARASFGGRDRGELGAQTS